MLQKSPAPIDLSGQAPLSQGQSRIVYQHPQRPDLLIKVPRPGSRDEERFYHSRPRRFSVWRYGGMRVWAREYDEYIALLWRNRELPTFISRYFGFCQTDLGPGMLVEKVLGADGGMARTLDQVRHEAPDDPRLAPLVEAFFDNLIRTDCVVSGLHLGNVVMRGDFEELVLIDGLGDIVLIKTKMFSRSLRRRSLLRRKDRMLAELGQH